MNCEQINKCIACDSPELTLVLDLKEQPLANSYKETETQEELCFPLAINVCNHCFHVQLTHRVNPDLLFKNYLYVSGTTKTQLEYFDWFSKYVVEQYDIRPSSILDIGCNDGSQLDYFKSLGLDTFGIDPAINLHPLSSANHTVICDYFSKELFDRTFDVIICQNAFPHNYDQYNFLCNVKEIMEDKTKLFIVTSQADMINNNEFDTIYHEHMSFYSIKSMDALCKRAGLNLIDVNQHHIHGKSNIFVISKSHKRDNHIQNLIENERRSGAHALQTYKIYAEKCNEIVSQFAQTIKGLRKKNIPIIGYGAPAKGNTLMNFSNERPDFIVDDNPLKHNMFTPGMSVPIYGPNKLEDISNKEQVCFVPLAWNFFHEIKKRISLIRSIDKQDLFLTYFPTVSIQGKQQ